MALMIDIRMPDWMTETALRDRLAPMLPGVTIYAGHDGAERADVAMLAVSKLHAGAARAFPNLKLVQKLGAGVETILRDPDLPAHIRVARLKPDAPAREIAEYALAYILRDQRRLAAHAADAARGRWRPRAPRAAEETTVAVLGLGHIGGRVARTVAALGFRTIGWSRAPKSLPEIDARAGPEALPGVLAEADYIVSVLPSTPDTVDLFDAARLAQLKSGACLINVGRGDLIVEADLLAALDAGRPERAVLDVFRQEPLPADHPFWRHPRITVTPHVSGWRVDGGLETVAENYRRLSEGEPLLHEVDRAAGY